MELLRCFAVLAALFATIQAQTFHRTTTQQVGSRFNFFDIELLKEVIAQEGHHNFVISPVSVKAVLAMLLEGSAGKTAAEIEKAMRLTGNKEHHRAVFNSFLHSLKVKYAGTAVEFANQIFVSPQIKLLEQYRKILDEIYLSGVENVDFTETQLAAATINGWVSRNTHGIIRTLVSPQKLDHTKAMVANALYFRGRWAVPFNPDATTKRCFYSKPDQCKNSFFMETEGVHGYANIKDLNAKVLELQYQSAKFSMLFLLPNNDIDELLRDLSYQPLNTIIPKLEYTTVVVSLPRFSIEFETDLTHPLRKLGVQDLFTPAANLSGMADRGGNVFINKIFQKSVIEIDEQGTIGAAVSGAVAVPLQGPTLPKFDAVRPFLFFVRDMETGNYLFEGLVEQPELADSNGPISQLPPNIANPGHTHLTPVNLFPNVPVVPKIEEVPPASNQPTRTPNGAAAEVVSPNTESEHTPGLATVPSVRQPIAGFDNINYPK